MTSEEIRAAIDRLQVLTDTDIVTALTGEYGWTDKRAREHLIDLLQQADPDTHMELPVDADGVPIHVGDKMEGASVIGTVTSVSSNGIALDHLVYHFSPHTFKHYHKTVEDVLREFALEWFDVDDDSNLVAEYSDRLKELIQDEQ